MTVFRRVQAWAVSVSTSPTMLVPSGGMPSDLYASAIVNNGAAYFVLKVLRW